MNCYKQSTKETKIRLLNDWKCNSVANDPRIKHKQVKMLFALYSAQCGKVEQNNWKLDCRIYLLPYPLLTTTCTVGRKQWLYKLLYLEKSVNELIWLLVILQKKKKQKKTTSTTCAVLARGPKQRRETKMLAAQKQFVPCWCLEWCVLLQSDLTHNAATYDSMLISYAYMHIWEREMMIQCHLFFHCGKLHPRLFLNDELLNNWWSITSTQIWTETMETNGINNMLQLEQRGIKEEKKKSLVPSLMTHFTHPTCSMYKLN